MNGSVMLNAVRIDYTRNRTLKKKGGNIWIQCEEKKGHCGVLNNKELRDCIPNQILLGAKIKENKLVGGV
jgi:hypothetical protein